MVEFSLSLFGREKGYVASTISWRYLSLSYREGDWT